MICQDKMNDFVRATDIGPDIGPAYCVRCIAAHYKAQHYGEHDNCAWTIPGPIDVADHEPTGANRYSSRRMSMSSWCYSSCTC